MSSTVYSRKAQVWSAAVLGLATMTGCFAQLADQDELSAEESALNEEDVSSVTQALSYGIQGFAWVHLGTPVGHASYSTSGGAITAKHPSKGHYTVSFAGLGDATGKSGGNVQVVAVGSSNSRCKPYKLSSNGSTTETVSVTCHTAAGASVDSDFLIQFGRGTKNSVGEIYALATKAAVDSASGEISAAYSWNSGGGKNYVVKYATGDYYVWSSKPPCTGAAAGVANGCPGSVKVSAYGDNPTHCNFVRTPPENIPFAAYPAVDAASWATAHVRCFDAKSKPIDSSFSYEFTAYGQVGVYDLGAHVYAHRPAETSPYAPMASQSYHSTLDVCGPSGENRISRYARGSYTVLHTKMPWDRSTVFVTAETSNDNLANYCKVLGWGPPFVEANTDVKILCFLGNGDAADTKFLETFYSQDKRICNW